MRRRSQWYTRYFEKKAHIVCQMVAFWKTQVYYRDHWALRCLRAD